LRNSNGERTGELSVEYRQGNSLTRTLRPSASSETRVSKEFVGWDQLFHEGTFADELVDVLDRQDANSSRSILKEWAFEMDDEGMPL